ncbi:hypothetical protein [Mameliella sp.]|uniref:hypothetical protein n=1 Tax=Mameliella sp. TaxID=1924940 RepID=UPI003B50480B
MIRPLLALCPQAGGAVAQSLPAGFGDNGALSDDAIGDNRFIPKDTARDLVASGAIEFGVAAGAVRLVNCP